MRNRGRDREDVEKDDDDFPDKTQRQKRFHQKKLKKEKEIQRDFPNRLEGPRHRRNRIQWQGGDFDYQEEYGED